MKVRFLRPAEEEVLAALEYYGSKSLELSAAFVADVDKRRLLLGDSSTA